MRNLGTQMRAHNEVGVSQRIEKHKKEQDQDGGAEGNRTPDLNIANVALSQLSYSPVLIGPVREASRDRGSLPNSRGNA